MSQEQQTTEARRKVEALLAKQALLFDGAGNKNTQNSPLGVPQSWKLESLDANVIGCLLQENEMIDALDLGDNRLTEQSSDWGTQSGRYFGLLSVIRSL